MFCENYDMLVKDLEKRSFTVHSAADAEEAKTIALSIIGNDTTVGCGGSMTVHSLGLPDALRAQGCEVFFHWEHAPADRPSVFPKAAGAEWYVCSTNGITKSAKLVNIDHNGNRVAGMFFGPKKVMLIIGKNKLSDNVEASIERIKAVACPANARRLNRTIPCATAGYCTDCYAAERQCRITTIIECKPGLVDEMHLVLVDEMLGF